MPTANSAPDLASEGWLGSVLGKRGTASVPTSGGILQGAVPDRSQEALPATAFVPPSGLPPFGSSNSNFSTPPGLSAVGSTPSPLALLWNGSPSLPPSGPKQFGASGNSTSLPLPQVSLDPWQAPIFAPFDATGSASTAAAVTNQSPHAGDFLASRRGPVALVATDPPRSIPADFFLSMPRGILSGLTGTASAGGQAAQLEMQQPVDVPSAEEATEIAEQNVTGPLPKPQGIGGQFGATIGSFIGNPLTYIFPGSLGSKLLMGITAGLGSETAGQLTKGMRAEPYARFAGALLGGGLGAPALARGTAAAESAANAVRGSGGQLAHAVDPSISSIKPPELEIPDLAEAPSIAPGPIVSRADLDAYRARLGVPDDIHTIAVGRTDVPGLENEIFEGASPSVRQAAGLPHATRGDIKSPAPLTRDQEHAEEDLFNRFKRRVEDRRLKQSDFEGRTLTIHVSNPIGVCSWCRAGLDSDALPGVLKQLSTLYRQLTIHVTVETEPGITPSSPTDFTIRDGRYISRNDR